ncbi:YopX family protein [Segatella copri]|uniref:YopX family protein n=1 Tax=Segatella copri TaxID=165179 RepID=UPI002230668A|nr:YopX family protein [Segatella copri]MCW4110102.1 YopX family protein [Segatella copri]MCW4120304.1 YopX family protein [Segatella copri]
MKTENIKFKAKRLDGKGWVCGYFYEENGNTYIIENRQKESKLNRNLPYQVDPSTVCIFTGLTDCEGKELFEHDLIHFVGFTHTAEVIWSEGNYAFMVVSENKHSYWLHNVIKLCRIERIGNKFDKKK